MISTYLGVIGVAPWAKAALRYGAIALTIVLFLLSIRRSGERVGRIAERLETREKTAPLLSLSGAVPAWHKGPLLCPCRDQSEAV